MPPFEKFLAIANRDADSLAKSGLSCHPEVPDSVQQLVRFNLVRAKATVRVISAVLRLFPLEQLTRTAVPPKLKAPTVRVSAGGWHSWCAVPGGVSCSVCGSVSPLPRGSPGLELLGCPGPAPALKRVAAGVHPGASGRLHFGDRGSHHLSAAIASKAPTGDKGSHGDRYPPTKGDRQTKCRQTSFNSFLKIH